ncbi:unnamed protein product [Ilex paraguariensis]|uniref:Uncharacterized protein n=1 Tax=Ilex paraguariensis TaxID=185542 RepID=A0ABC8R5X3_9AQUA
MQCSSAFCSANPLSPSLYLSTSPRFTVPSQKGFIGSVSISSCIGHLPLNYSRINKRTTLSSLQSNATQEMVQTTQNEVKFVEIGYISSVHGLQGEVRVKGRTDFPELRFSKPGRRWLRQQVSGREKIQVVDLVEGRGQSGQKGWIVKFSEVDTADKAQLLVGSTMLVMEEERPALAEDEFYSRDLIGMRVILKETGEPVGTVANIFNTGASDLLHVMLNSHRDRDDGNGRPASELSASGPLVWVPFVEAIIPHVDMNKREMQITPPKGLLELNVRSDERSKKERRQIEWKKRKRLIAAKKKLCEMEQQHVFHGFRFGEKAQTSLLADQIVGVNSRLLQHALQNIEIPSKRWSLGEFFKAHLQGQSTYTLKLADEILTNGSGEKLNANSRLRENGHLLTSDGKVAIVLVVDGSEKLGSGSDTNLVDRKRTEDPCLLLEALLCDDQRLVKIEGRASVPLILVCPAHTISSLQKLFSNNDHLGFDPKKVWFLEEEKLPVVSCSPEENKYKILMKSPWEILQMPLGSGGITSLLSSHGILENLSEMGVEYIEVRNMNQRFVGGQSLLGLVNSCDANIGIQVFEDMDNLEDNFDMIFSMKFMKQLTKQINKLHFQAISRSSTHVEKVDKEWVDVIPSSPNSYEFHCSIYGSLNACPPSKVCVIEVSE